MRKRQRETEIEKVKERERELVREIEKARKEEQRERTGRGAWYNISIINKNVIWQIYRFDFLSKKGPIYTYIHTIYSNTVYICKSILIKCKPHVVLDSNMARQFSSSCIVVLL